jgi:hypothetical protein
MSVSFSNTVQTPGQTSLTTKGDILSHDGTSAARLAVGSDGTVLTANSTSTLGASWQAAPSATDVMKLISSSTLTASASSIEFTSITSAYKALVLIGFTRSTSDDTSSNIVAIDLGTSTTATYEAYSFRRQGNGATASFLNAEPFIQVHGCAQSATNSNYFGSFEIYIGNYARTAGSPKPSIASRSVGFNSNPAVNLISAVTSGFRNTSGAITYIKVALLAGNLEVGSKVALYGLS